jgi:hypothetical protein
VGQRRLRLPGRRPPGHGATPACGGSRSCAAIRASTRSSRASTRCAGWTCPTPPSSRATRGSSSSTHWCPPRPPPLPSRCTASTAVTGAVRSRGLHPQPRGPLRRDPRGFVTQAEVAPGSADLGAGGLHRARRVGKRVRGHGDGPARRLHVRHRPWTAGPRWGRLRSRAGPCPPGRWRSLPPTSTSTTTGAEAHPRRGARSSFQMAPGTEAPSECTSTSRLPGPVHGRERHPQPAQPAHPARCAWCATRTPGRTT